MEIPNSIKVAGVRYEVVDKEIVEIEGSTFYNGACNYDEAQILLLDSLTGDRKEQVFVHELTHAIFFEAGFEEQDEDMVNRLGIVLHQVLKDWGK